MWKHIITNTKKNHNKKTQTNWYFLFSRDQTSGGHQKQTSRQNKGSLSDLHVEPPDPVKPWRITKTNRSIHCRLYGSVRNPWPFVFPSRAEPATTTTASRLVVFGASSWKPRFWKSRFYLSFMKLLCEFRRYRVARVGSERLKSGHSNSPRLGFWRGGRSGRELHS